MEPVNANIEIITFPDSEWAKECAALLNAAVEAACKKKSSCSVMLTGGRSAERVYNEWSHLLKKNGCSIDFYFGDERCVPADHIDSNYQLAINALFPSVDPRHTGNVHKITGNADDPEQAAQAYEKILPRNIDILLLSIGEDGHIASLFPNSSSILESERSVIHVTGPKPPNQRITITQKIIANAERIFSFVTGEIKGKVFAEVIQEQGNVLALPARLAFRGTWVIDESAALSIKERRMEF